MFDTDDHNILFEKLYKYGFNDALKWLLDYLKGRDQYVSGNKHN